jgi:hypothetical protein
MGSDPLYDARYTMGYPSPYQMGPYQQQPYPYQPYPQPAYYAPNPAYNQENFNEYARQVPYAGYASVDGGMRLRAGY